MNNICIFSKCRKYRYSLSHWWDADLPIIVWIGLNPSSADEIQLDPTLRRVKGYSKEWGYGGFKMLNLFAFRSTDPKGMMEAEDPIGSENDNLILDSVNEVDKVILMWGKHGKFKERDLQVINRLDNSKLFYLKMNQDNTPAHCLYLKKDLKPISYSKCNSYE